MARFELLTSRSPMTTRPLRRPYTSWYFIIKVSRVNTTYRKKFRRSSWIRQDIIFLKHPFSNHLILIDRQRKKYSFCCTETNWCSDSLKFAIPWECPWFGRNLSFPEHADDPDKSMCCICYSVLPRSRMTFHFFKIHPSQNKIFLCPICGKEIRHKMWLNVSYCYPNSGYPKSEIILIQWCSQCLLKTCVVC